ncbi:hypothetical protein AX16_004259 [Volvariella volvacea WC 439]|nr:hypothetical protein AX16_004259 [Volvariella volvacea WC 439]
MASSARKASGLGANQPRISSFFASTPSATAKRRASSPIDLTNDSDLEEPPAKKSRSELHSTTAATSPQRDQSSSQKKGASAIEQWRFAPHSPEKRSPKTQKQLDVEKSRREEFRKRLLMDSEKFARKPPDETAPDTEEEKSESSGDDSDQAWKELSALFSNKGKGKATKGRTQPPAKRGSAKKAEVIGPSGQPYTPLELQVVQLKKENPGTVLMVEVGYKYKFFGDDADIAAKELGMVSFNDRNFLVASIPVHRRDVHLKKLLAQGYRVGIVNQVETAALKKASENRNAPFERRVTHLYTAATYVDELTSVDDQERYTPPPFMCLMEQNKTTNGSDVSVGMIIICPSTGDVVWDDFDDGPMRIELETRLVHTRPSELLLPQEGLSEPTSKMLSHFTGVSTTGKRTRTEFIDQLLSYDDAFSLVSDFYTDKKAIIASESFRSGKLMATIVDLPKRVVIALAHAIKYLCAFGIADAFLETQFFSRFTSRAHMLLAANTLTNLEIYRNETDQTVKGSLVWILDKTKTKFGARLLRSWVGRPLIDKRALQERIDAVEEILSSSSEKLVALRQLLSTKNFPDLTKGLCRIQYGQCTPEELAKLLPAFNQVALAFEPGEENTFKSVLLNEIITSLPKLRDCTKKLLGAISLRKAAEGRKDEMWTDPERYPAIDDAKVGIHAVEAELMDELKTIRKLLKMPSLKYTTVAGEEYLIEVKKSENRPIPTSWILVSRTKTLARYHPPSVKAKLEERAQFQELLQIESNRGYRAFLEEISQEHYTIMREAVNKLALADCLISLALVALQDNYVKPEFADDDTLEIVDGRHPMIEVIRPDPFVPNTISMGGDHPRSKIITGPNMGGKSSCVRMVALVAIMAQIGSYVPAKSMKLGLLDSILTRMGASDDLARGRSTFMVEMSETSDILRTATERSLVILDELGRGTSTFDGMAIADATLHQLVQVTKCKTLFITHYPSIAADLEKRFPLDVENLHMSYAADTRIDGTREITFLYQLIKGLATESFGIECGRLAGLPEKILAVAAEKASVMQDEVKQRRKHNLYVDVD